MGFLEYPEFEDPKDTVEDVTGFLFHTDTITGASRCLWSGS